MNRATKIALISLINSPLLPRPAFFHSTPVLDCQRHTHWESRPNFNARRQREFYAEEEMPRNSSAFAENNFHGSEGYNESDPDSFEGTFGEKFWSDINAVPPDYNLWGIHGVIGVSRLVGPWGESVIVDEDPSFPEYTWEDEYEGVGDEDEDEYEDDRYDDEDEYEDDRYEDEDEYEYEEDGYEDDSDRWEAGLRRDRITLGLSDSGTLSLEEVKNAYRVCALKWHPDRHDGSSKANAEEKFKVCSAAYESLCHKLAYN